MSGGYQPQPGPRPAAPINQPIPTFAECVKPRASNASVFTHEDWAVLIDRTVAEIKKLGALKGGEYSGDVDRLANFRRNGANLGLPMETVWAVYAGKHWDAIQQYVQDQRNGKARERLEPIAGRVDDLLVYLLLFKAMLVERGELDLL